jgi:Bacterial protein of unknown function (DUF899)
VSTRTVDNPKIVSREQWLVARKKLLAREKQVTRECDAIAADRRQLPWVKVEKNYVFDSPGSKETLADLFNGKSQLIVYHLMLVRSGKRPAPAAPSTWTIRTRHCCTWRSATFPLRPFPARPFPKSKPSRSAWDGSSTGFRLTRVISTTTIASPSLQNYWSKARSSSTLSSRSSPARKRQVSVSSTGTKTAISSTPILPTRAAPRPR